MPAARDKSQAHANFTILFVEDESVVSGVLQRLIETERSHWRPIFASNAEEAIHVLASETVDVIVMDLEMPDENGIEFLEKVKAEYPQMPRVSMSGSLDAKLLSKAISLTHAQIAKPYTFNEVSTAVEKCIAFKNRNTNEKPIEREISFSKLPAAPRIYLQLSRALEQDEVDRDRVSQIVSQDPAIASKILQIINSPFFSVGQRIDSIDEAIAHLGYNTLKALVLSQEIYSNFSVGEDFDELFAKLQQQAFRTAMIARELVILTDRSRQRADAAYLSGLLANLGKLVFVANDRDRFMEVALAHQDEILENQEQALEDAFGISHVAIGIRALKHWNFDPEVVEAISDHRSDSFPESSTSLSCIIHYAVILACGSHEDWDSAFIPEDIEKNGINPEAFALWMDSMQEFFAM